MTIQFGSGGDNVLNIGGTSVTFNNSSGFWGDITLSGRISRTGTGVIFALGNGASITSSVSASGGEFRMTGSAELTIIGGTISNGIGGCVVHNSTGLLTISGGIFSSGSSNGTIRLQNADSRMEMSGGTVRYVMENNPDRFAIWVQSDHENAVIISGGTVGSMDVNSVHGGTITEFPGMAIRSTGTGGITIRGNALITSRSTSNGTIKLENATGGSLRIEGGSVRNRNPTNNNPAGPAITRAGSQTVTRTGGTINPMPEWLN